MEDNKEMLEYVKQIRDLNKKRVFWSRIIAAALIVFVLLFASVVPTVMKTLNSANDAMVKATEALDQAEEIMAEMTTTIDTMEVALNSITHMVDESEKSLTAAFEGINSIDFEGLNKAIKDLGDVVEPLSKFFRKF